MNVAYRQSYVEKDRCVRNSTAAPIPGVDHMQGFEMSKEQFEQVFNQAAEQIDNSRSFSAATATTTTTTTNITNATEAEPTSGRTPLSRTNRLNILQRKEKRRKDKAGGKPPTTPNNKKPPQSPGNVPKSPASDASTGRGFRQRGAPNAPITPAFGNAAEAVSYADSCRRDGAALQRSVPADYEGAGSLFEKACDTRARYGLFCTQENADAHVEYAQNLSKRGLTPEAEYHLRSAADIFRMLNARAARKYGDVLLYTAVVVDRQGRLAEAENFYRSALAVYRANKLSDDNVRVAIDSLSNNLRAQGRGDEVDTIVQRHFLGAVA